MKKLLAFLTITFSLACTAFADGSEQAIELTITIDELTPFFEREFEWRNTTYLLTITGVVPQEVTAEQIDTLHWIMAANARNKILGDIEYIYFDGTHSTQVFRDIRERIEAAEGKFVCVDIGNSNYAHIDGTRYPLPQNCFAGHENLWWVYEGSFAGEVIPHNFCADCKNLRIAFLWKNGKVARTAFSGTDASLLIVGEFDETQTISEFKEKAVLYDEWDYRAFDGSTFVSAEQAGRKSRDGGSWWENYDDDDSDWWENDDDDDEEADEYADFPDELPPVSQERLEKILTEIVARENYFIDEEESDDAFEEDDCVFLHAHGNTYCVVPSELSPYEYFRLVNPDPDDDTPNLLYVIYGRPTKENMRYYARLMQRTRYESAEEELDFDDYAWSYNRAKSFTITLNTTVTIGGVEYEAVFTDIDDDQDDDDSGYYDDDDDDSDFEAWLREYLAEDDDNDEYADYPDELPPVAQEQLEKILAQIVERESEIIAEEESDDAIIRDGYGYIHAGGNTILINTGNDTPYRSYRLENPDPDDGTPNLIYVVYARPTQVNMRLYARRLRMLRYDNADDYEVDNYRDIYNKAKSFTITLNTTVTIGGTEYEVLFTDIDDDQDNSDEYDDDSGYYDDEGDAQHD